jgi:hypothetical protein
MTVAQHMCCRLVDRQAVGGKSGVGGHVGWGTVNGAAGRRRAAGWQQRIHSVRPGSLQYCSC